MHHLYLQLDSSDPAQEKHREALETWCTSNNISTYNIIEDNLTGNIRPAQVEALLAPIHPGDTLIAETMSTLGRSLPMLLQVMEHLLARRCTLITLDGRTLLPNRSMTLFVNNLREIVTIESQMKTNRLCAVMKAKRASGVTLGRPQGARKSPEKSVLYGKEHQLQTLLTQGKGDQEIAQALGVSRNTIRNYRLSH